jgi:hypothetical protein
MKIQYYDNFIDYYKSYNIRYADIVLVKKQETNDIYSVEKDRTGLLPKNQYIHIDEITEILLFKNENSNN